MIILFGMPIAQVLLFGFVITNEIKNAKIAILDKSKDEVTLAISNKILSSGYFILDKNISTQAEIEQSFKEGEIKQVIIFEDDFAGRLVKENKAHIQILADASEPNTANLLVNYTNAIVRDYINKTIKDKRNVMQIVPQVRMMYNENLKGVYMFVPGIMAMILMLVSAMMTSISIAREKELGTMEVLLVSPLKPIQVILGKVTPYFVLSFVSGMSILLLGRFVFNVPIHGSTIMLLLITMLFTLLALSLGILISTVSSSQQTAMVISMFALMLPTILLSGFIFPIENMPIFLQVLSNIMPPRWFIIILKNIMLKGTDFMYIWKETLILLGMTFFFIVMSAKKYKIRLE